MPASSSLDLLHAETAAEGDAAAATAVSSVALLDVWTRPLPDAVLDGGALAAAPVSLSTYVI